jgi:hypothetical protein
MDFPFMGFLFAGAFLRIERKCGRSYLRVRRKIAPSAQESPMKPLSRIAMATNAMVGMPAVANSLRFTVGPDAYGHWVAVEQHGLGGGIFKSREAAVHYAAQECGRRPGGVKLVSQAISLH